MFGFSLPKLLVLLAIVVAVWYGFKFLGRLEAKRKAELSAGAGKGSDGDTQNMVQCPVCKTYVAASGATACGRADCPY